ncbi:Hsp20/alpha crystallin family protein [Streptomyces sp. 6N223]|uniref:Hsp20/alpha crystallin family protein n=1 Tax=Streptomyces sp. 6N223 TaxID=3457412 RepID=UPI003FD1E256
MTLPTRRHRPMMSRYPFYEFDDLFNRIGSLLESTVAPGYGTPAERVSWAPLADLTETDDAYVVEAELPGLKHEDVDISVGEREIAITGELKEAEIKGTLHSSTRRTGHFEYRATLPGQVNADAVTATLKEGVLTVIIPKAAETGVRHVEIEPGD